MIGKLKGRIDSTGPDWVMIDVGGVCYHVFCSAKTLSALPGPGEFAEIHTDMVHKVNEILNKIQWSESDIAQFLGLYLSEPKPDVIFDANKKISTKVFSEKLAKWGIALDLKSQMLFFGETFYLNGEAASFDNSALEILRDLADKRKIGPYTATDVKLLQQLYDWYIAGYLYFEGE